MFKLNYAHRYMAARGKRHTIHDMGEAAQSQALSNMATLAALPHHRPQAIRNSRRGQFLFPPDR